MKRFRVSSTSRKMARFDSVPPARFDASVRMDSWSWPGSGATKKRTMNEPALKLAQKDTAEVKILAGSLAAGLTANPTLVAAPKVTPTQLTDAAQAVTDQEAIVAGIQANLLTQTDILEGL